MCDQSEGYTNHEYRFAQMDCNSEAAAANCVSHCYQRLKSEY